MRTPCPKFHFCPTHPQSFARVCMHVLAIANPWLWTMENWWFLPIDLPLLDHADSVPKISFCPTHHQRLARVHRKPNKVSYKPLFPCLYFLYTVALLPGLFLVCYRVCYWVRSRFKLATHADLRSCTACPWDKESALMDGLDKDSLFGDFWGELKSKINLCALFWDKIIWNAFSAHSHSFAMK